MLIKLYWKYRQILTNQPVYVNIPCVAVCPSEVSKSIPVTTDVDDHLQLYLSCYSVSAGHSQGPP